MNKHPNKHPNKQTELLTIMATYFGDPTDRGEIIILRYHRPEVITLFLKITIINDIMTLQVNILNVEMFLKHHKNMIE